MTDVFSALADPTRRSLFESVARGEAATATELAADLPISRQAVAKHLEILRQAELVDAVRFGRETRFSATPAPLNEAMVWMAQVGGQWDERLARLAQSARRTA